MTDSTPQFQETLDYVSKLYQQGICYICREKNKGFKVDVARTVKGSTVLYGSHTFHVCDACLHRRNRSIYIALAAMLAGLAFLLISGWAWSSGLWALAALVLGGVSGWMILVAIFGSTAVDRRVMAIERLVENPVEDLDKYSYALLNDKGQVVKLYPLRFEEED